jgi:hypothetical protein
MLLRELQPSSERGVANERHRGNFGQPEEGPRRGLRQRPDPDPQPRRVGRGEPALHPRLPRVHPDPPGPQGHPHGPAHLAVQELGAAGGRDLHAGGLAAHPRGSDDALGDPARSAIQHRPALRHPAPVQGLDELPAGVRGIRLDPGPGEGSLPPDHEGLPGAGGGECAPGQRREHGGQGPPRGCSPWPRSSCRRRTRASRSS